MVKTFQYRIYPTKEQTQTLETQLEASKNIYNQALAWRRSAYEENGESVTYNTQQATLTPLRSEKPFWTSLHIDILQDTLRPLDKAYKAFFRRVWSSTSPRALAVGN